MKLTNPAKIALFSLPILVGIYLIYRQLKNNKSALRNNINDKENSIEEVKNTPKAIENPTENCDYPLKKGLYDCEMVRQLQKALNSYPNPIISRLGTNKVLPPLVEDGDFGSKTEEFLMSLTSELAIEENSNKIKSTLFTINSESDFEILVEEIDRIIQKVKLEILNSETRPGVSAPQPSTNTGSVFGTIIK